MRGLQSEPRQEEQRKPIDEREVQNIIEDVRVQLLKQGIFSLIVFGKNLKVGFAEPDYRSSKLWKNNQRQRARKSVVRI